MILQARIFINIYLLLRNLVAILQIIVPKLLQLQKINELNNYYPTAKAYKGKEVKFLSSDPKVLMNRLKILLAEKSAGNNNVFNEISVISDELRRSGALSLRQLKNLHKKLH